MRAIQTSEIVAIIFAFLFLAMVLIILARRKMNRNREGKEGGFTRENSTGSVNFYIDDSSGVRMVTLVEQPRPSPQQETIRRAHEFRERARRPPNLVRDTNGTECETVDPDEIDLESLEEGENNFELHLPEPPAGTFHVIPQEIPT